MTRHMPSNRQALLFLCHLTDMGHVRHYQALTRAFRPYGDAYFVFDVTHQPLPDALARLPNFTFTKDSLRNLGYVWLQDALMPGHVHFPMLEFARHHPGYTHYWVVEYDVRFNGPWRLFFWWANRVKADFLATHLYRHGEQPFWYWWRSLSCPEHEIDLQARIRFFGPLYRISREAVELLDTRLSEGCKGHQEVIIPTLLHQAGYRLMDLSRDSTLGQAPGWSWYTRSRERDAWGALNDSSMRFRPALESVGRRPFTFYHPIKAAGR